MSQLLTFRSTYCIMSVFAGSLLSFPVSLTVSHLCKSYPVRDGTLDVVQNCSFGLQSGDSLSISGPSGSGKSSLLSILGTLEPATSGSVILGGVDVPTL